MLEGKTALITGASRGIGKAIAVKLAEHGAFVGINYYSRITEAQKTYDTIKKKGGKAIIIPGDVSRDAEHIIKRFLDTVGEITILVNNAGIYHRKSITDLDITDWKHTLDTNLTGCFRICQEAFPHIPARGRVIFLSSQLAFRGTMHGADYAASKAGILGLMKSLALEYADKAITVNAIAPGIIDTDIIASYTPQMRKQRAQKIPLGRLGTPEDIANACLFLSSDLANYITGETLHVNGGIYLH